MEKPLSGMMSGLLFVLAAAGFKLRNKHLLRIMNIDVTHSMLRTPLVIILSYAATLSSLTNTRKILVGAGMLYLAIGTAGLADKRLGGLLPSGLTKFDLVYHFAVGGMAVWLGARPGRMTKNS